MLRFNAAHGRYKTFKICRYTWIMIALWHKKKCTRKPNITWITQTVRTLKQPFYTHITSTPSISSGGVIGIVTLTAYEPIDFLRSPRIQYWTILTFRASEYYFLITHFLIKKCVISEILDRWKRATFYPSDPGLLRLLELSIQTIVTIIWKPGFNISGIFLTESCT